MGSRGASASTSTGRGGAVNLAGAERIASRAVDRFLANNDMMASDGELNGVYEDTFVREATKLGASNLEINNALNKALRTDSVDYMAARAKETKLSNKQSMIDYVKRQTNVDLAKVVEPRANKSRTYLGVHLEDLPRSQQNAVRNALNSYGKKIRIESNGGLGDAIYYEKGK